jgi:hypothetical protein
MVVRQNEPQLVITAKIGDVPVRGICSVCPNIVFDTGSKVGKRKDHERKLNDLFSQHLKEKHARENDGRAA